MLTDNSTSINLTKPHLSPPNPATSNSSTITSAGPIGHSKSYLSTKAPMTLSQMQQPNTLALPDFCIFATNCSTHPLNIHLTHLTQ
jgi:hypothetical protein